MNPGPDLDALVAEHVMRAGRMMHYSTSISAAWEVVEKLTNEGWMFDSHSRNREQIYFHVEFSFVNEYASAFKASMPESICIAALKAKGVKIDE